MNQLYESGISAISNESQKWLKIGYMLVSLILMSFTQTVSSDRSTLIKELS